ncbi:MAG: hypothetical protein AAF799_04075 [Myxococcota bacterium]
MNRAMSMGLGVLASAGLLLAACGGADGTGSSGMTASGSATGSAMGSGTGGDMPIGSGGTTPYGSSTDWWMTTGAASFDGGSAGIPGDEEGEEEGKDEEGGKEEDFVGWFGEGTINPGTSYDGFLEAIAFVEGVDHCVLLITPADVTWLDTCAECEFAFSYTLNVTKAEVDSGCATYGFDVDTLSGSTHSVGYAAETLYWLEDGQWQGVGDAEYDPGKGLFGYTRGVQ